MENAPTYLVVYFIRIRHLADSTNALPMRLAGKGSKTVIDELSMLKDLDSLGFIALSKDNVCLRVRRGLDGDSFEVPESFTVLARGRYWWTELLATALLWVATSALGAAITLMVTKELE